MNDSNTAVASDAERRADALAEVRQMLEDLDAQRKEIAELQRSLDRADDRMVLLSEERTRYRHEAQLYRTKLVELATVQSNIGLLVVRADDIMKSVNELLAAVTPKDEEQEKTILGAIADGIEGDTHAPRDN